MRNMVFRITVGYLGSNRSLALYILVANGFDELASQESAMAQTGHRRADMVRRYIREGSLFRDNAAAEVGL